MRKYMSKRQRPCDFCRSRKTGCRIEGSPPCRFCQLHGRECTFVEAAPPRKRPLVEARTSPRQGVGDSALVDVNSQDDHDGTNRDLAPGTHRHGASTDPSCDTPNTVGPSDVAFGGSSSFPDMSMQFPQDLYMDGLEYQFMFRTPGSSASHLPPVGDGPGVSPASSSQPKTTPSQLVIDELGEANPETLGLTGDMDPYLLQKYRIDDRGVFRFKQLAIHAVQQDPIPVQFLVSHPSIFAKSREEAGHSEVNQSELRDRLEQLVSKAMGSRLIPLYQRFIAPQYPIFSEQTLPDPSTSPVHLLAAIYSITFPFAMYDDQLCIDLAYDAFPYSSLSQITNSALAADLHSPSLAVIQTALLLVLRPSSNPLVSNASYRWNTLGTLVTAAVSLGLHLNPSPWSLPPWQIAQRRRLSFAIFTIDLWLAASLGRPPLIDEKNWLVTSLREEDRLQSGLSEEHWAYLTSFSRVSRALSRTISDLYSLRASEELLHQPKRLADIAGRLTQELCEKCIDEKESNQMPEDDMPPIARTIATLGYHYTKLLILRATLRPFLGAVSSDPLESPDDVGIRFAARNSMQHCAEKFYVFVKSLKAEDINGFWPPWCQTAFSSLSFMLLLMAISSQDSDEASWWIKLLYSTRKELRLKANSFPVLRLSLLRIDSIFWRGVDKVLKVPPHVNEAFIAL